MSSFKDGKSSRLQAGDPHRVTRRSFTGVVGAMAATGAAASWVPANAAEEATIEPIAREGYPNRPNIMVIVADDLGWGDLSCYGHPKIRTPNLDALARSGIRFTDGYSASSVCSPTRFSLYTGRYPGRFRGGLEEPIGLKGEEYGIPLDHPTLATLLKGVGYKTAMLGKWHCGYLPWFSPTKLGWDVFFGSFAGGVDYYSKLNVLNEYDLFENEIEYHDLRYYTRILTERAVEFVGKRHRKPWLLNLNYTTPHWPWEAPGDREESRRITDRIENGEPGYLVLAHKDGGSLETYKAMVEDLDRSVGKVMTALRESGELQNTLVLFTSDNGGERFSYNWPFTGAKFSTLEGGIRVPTILSWPGTLPGKKVSHAPNMTQDWMATLLEFGGAKPKPSHPLDGVSLAGYLTRGESVPQRDLFWRMRNSAALRRGNMKYYEDNSGAQLFDLAADPHEQANLASRRTKTLSALKSRWQEINSELLPYPTE